MTTMSIYHNVTQDSDGRPAGRLYGYRSGYHLLTKVYELEVTDGADWLAACDYAWDVFNIGHEAEPKHPAAVDYRARDNRSLCIGDVIEYDGKWYASMSAGWGELERPPSKRRLVDKVLPGTTPASLAITRCTARAWMRGEATMCKAVLDTDGQCFNADRHIGADVERVLKAVAALEAAEDCCPGAGDLRGMTV